MFVSRRTAIANYRKSILDALKQGSLRLLPDIMSLRFYTIVVDYDTLDGRIVVSMNTEFDYHRRHCFIKNDPNLTPVAVKAAIDSLRYDTEYFQYQAFIDINPIETELFKHYFENKSKAYLKVLHSILLEFVASDTYNLIPKTNDFTLVMRNSTTRTCQSVIA